MISSLITADQILCHMLGDYIIQSDWMAQNKTKRNLPAIVHAFTYSIPFIVMFSLQGFNVLHGSYAISVIVFTHFLIDRYRLARYLCWAKNFTAPVNPISNRRNDPWSECQGTGYSKEVPPWMSVWLMIIVDNVCHILINALAIKFFIG